MVVYTLEQRWEVGLRSTNRRCIPPQEYDCIYACIPFAKWACDRLTEELDFAKKKNHLFRWSSFWSWRVCKQSKLSHLGHRKPACIHWKAEASKTSQCLVRIFSQKHNWTIFLRKWARGEPLQAIVIGPCWTNFCLQKLKRMILATFGFNRTALRATAEATLDVLCAVSKDASISRRADVVWPPRSCSLTPLAYYL